MFGCFVDYDAVNAPSNLRQSLIFENININDKVNLYGYADKYEK